MKNSHGGNSVPTTSTTVGKIRYDSSPCKRRPRSSVDRAIVPAIEDWCGSPGDRWEQKQLEDARIHAGLEPAVPTGIARFLGRRALLLGCLGLVGCGAGGVEQQDAAPQHLTMIGDSITRGWPPALLAPWQIRNLGIPGETARQIADRFDQALKVSPVILMAGTNDCSIFERPDFAPMLEMVAKAAGRVRLIVCTIPPIANDDANGGALAVRARGLWWNEQIRALPVRVADVYAATNVPGAIGPDNVHVTPLGYDLASAELRSRLSTIHLDRA